MRVSLKRADSSDRRTLDGSLGSLGGLLRHYVSTLFLLEGIQEDLVGPTPGHMSSAGSDLHNFDAGSDTAFKPTPTTSMGAFTNLTSQTNHSYPVSEPWFDRRY